MINEAIHKLVDRVDLTGGEMAGAMGEIADGRASAAQTGAFLVALRGKGETVEELLAAAREVRGRSLRVRVARGVFVDTCGTGGDGARTFNISTAAAIVAAAAGLVVAKHGGGGVSSRSGSADVLSALGARVDLAPQGVERCIEATGMGFLFAPRMHPAFKAAAGIRRELGLRTIFNLLGPLSNPAGARHQVLGVFSPGLVPVVARVLAALGAERALVVHGGGLDEISVSGPTTACEVRGGEVRSLTIDPASLGLGCFPIESLAAGDPEGSARIVRGVLEGQRGAPRDAVLANASAALLVGGLAASLAEGVATAARAIDDGRALARLAAFVQATREAA
jgi:anthranilate phosphoribosyltransferase